MYVVWQACLHVTRCVLLPRPELAEKTVINEGVNILLGRQ
jgi:hypothetical protein